MSLPVLMKKLISLLVCLLLVTMLGCGPASDFTSVSGTVNLDGEPLKSGNITFMPADGGTRTSSGEIVDGHYTLSTVQKGDGAPDGKYNVAISSWSVEPSMESPKGVSAIPKKYTDGKTSGLTADVTKENHTFDFELQK